MLTNIVRVIEGEKKINRKGNKINSMAGGSSYLVKDATNDFEVRLNHSSVFPALLGVNLLTEAFLLEHFYD